MKTQKAVYLLQGNTSHVYPIAYLLDNCLEDFCTCLWLENYRGLLINNQKQLLLVVSMWSILTLSLSGSKCLFLALSSIYYL